MFKKFEEGQLTFKVQESGKDEFDQLAISFGKMGEKLRSIIEEVKTSSDNVTMGSHQMSERQVLDSVMAEAIKVVFDEYIEKHGLAEITEIFARGVKIEVGDLVPSAKYVELLKRVPPVWDKAFEVNASEDPAVRASCVEFVLAGLHATDRISRAQHRGGMTYEIP